MPAKLDNMLAHRILGMLLKKHDGFKFLAKEHLRPNGSCFRFKIYRGMDGHFAYLYKTRMSSTSFLEHSKIPSQAELVMLLLDAARDFDVTFYDKNCRMMCVLLPKGTTLEQLEIGLDLELAET